MLRLSPWRTEFQPDTPQSPITFSAPRADTPGGLLALLSSAVFTQAKVGVTPGSSRSSAQPSQLRTLRAQRGLFGVCTPILPCKSWQAKNGRVTNVEVKL